jgi:hypothetical protein
MQIEVEEAPGVQAGSSVELETAVWRLTDGRGTPDGKAASGRLDFVLQVPLDRQTDRQACRQGAWASSFRCRWTDRPTDRHAVRAPGLRPSGAAGHVAASPHFSMCMHPARSARGLGLPAMVCAQLPRGWDVALVFRHQDGPQLFRLSG